MELNGQTEIRVETQSTTVTRVGGLAIQKPDITARQALQQEPAATPLMFQTWSDLLFLHWEWDPSEIQTTLPPGLYVDTFGDKAYVGLIPFRMTDVRASFLPKLPGATNFLELNVRTYVHDASGRPGVWFYSLDLNHGLGVLLARTFYSLPYYSATMEAEERAGLIQFKCHRQTAAEASSIHYRKGDETVPSPPGSLAYFLADRWLLYSYSARTGKLYSARVHHPRWELFRATVGKCDNVMLRLNHLHPRLSTPHLQWYASPVRVKIYALEEA